MPRGETTARVIHIRQRTHEARLQAPTAEIYGYRGQAAVWFYLSAYEFFAYWTPVEVRAPKVNGEEGFSVWTPEGEQYMQSCLEDKVIARPKPLTHFTVVEPKEGSSYHTLPDTHALRWLRHQWVLVRQERPKVPVFHKQQVPSSKRTANENGRLCNVYLRP